MSLDLNILDWGNNNCIGTALGCEVFIWHAETGMVDQLMQTGDNDIVTSVKWINEGNVLAVGLNNGTVEVCRNLSCIMFVSNNCSFLTFSLVWSL